MKKACRQVDGYSEWGESDVSGSLNYLFKRGKFQQVTISISVCGGTDADRNMIVGLEEYEFFLFTNIVIPN